MPKRCKNCSTPLIRKRFNGRLEDNGVFQRRVFCYRSCMAEGMEGVTKVHNDRNGRRQAQKLNKGFCEVCGRKDLSRKYVHHKDENPQNNSQGNLITLCGSCHRRSHSPNYTAMGTQHLPCRFCKRPSYRLGICCTHLTRLKKHGHPLKTKIKRGSGWQLIKLPGPSWRAPR